MTDFPGRDVHGGTGRRERERSGRNILDFSASINPFPPSVSWQPDQVDLGQYPDDRYHALREAIAAAFHRPADEICVGNGSIELIRVFCSVLLRGEKTYSTDPHTFGEYALSARLAGAVRAGSVREADAAFLCNPNNPTASLRDRDEVLGHLEDAGSRGHTLFVDEAFIELSDPGQSLAGVRDPNLFVLRSLTKSFSVPALRFGYGFGDADLVERIEISRPPWSVNAYAEAFALRAMQHLGELEDSRRRIAVERKVLLAGMNDCGLSCHPSSANFILAESGRDVSALCARLADHDILVRNCSSFGLPTCIRVAVRTREENRVLLEALSRCMP